MHMFSLLVGVLLGVGAAVIGGAIMEDTKVTAVTASAYKGRIITLAVVAMAAVGLFAYQYTQIQTLMPYAEAFQQMAKDKGIDLSKQPASDSVR